MLKTPRELLKETFDLYKKNFWVFIGYAAWLLLPQAGYFLIVLMNISSSLDRPIITVLMILVTLLHLFVSLWAGICIMHVVKTIKEQKPLDPNEISAIALKRIQPVLATAFLQVLIFLGGFLLLIVPSIIFWVWYAFAQVISALEYKKPIEALTLSKQLSRGRGFPILWRLISGPMLIGFTYLLILGAFTSIISAFLGLESDMLFAQQSPIWIDVLESLISTLVMPLFVVYHILLYRNLVTTLDKPQALT